MPALFPVLLADRADRAAPTKQIKKTIVFFFRETLMAKIFYGWWRKHQLLMDVRMMERMVRILTFLFAHVLFI